MSNFKESFEAGLFLGLLLWIVVGTIFVFVSNTQGYKAGQIQAINGNIEYELREMEDGSMKWRKIKDE